MSRFRVFIISGGIAVLSTLSSAQPPADERGQEPGGGTEGTMAMGEVRGMMESCRQRFEAMMQAVQNARTATEEGMRSSDPGRMRSALLEIQEGLQEMEGNAARCQEMMGRMSRMGGGSPSGGMMPRADDGECDVMCRGMMQMEMQRWGWMAPWGVLIGLLGTTALALLVALEVLWIRHWLRRVREPAPAARS